MKRLTRVLDLMVLAAIVALSGCSREIESEAAAGSGEGLQLRLAGAADITLGTAGYRSFLYSERDADVYSRLGSGDYFEQGVLVMALHTEVGDQVAAGQLLATLEDDAVRLEYEAAQAAADDAAANFRRIDELRQRELVPPAEYDAALYAKRYADAAFKRAQLDLSRTRVRAPFTGVVAKRYVRVGDLIEGSTPLFRITAMAPLRVRVLVPESSSDVFHSGASVQLTGANGETATARVVVVGPTVDPGSATREVVIELAEPGEFRPGASVLVEPLQVREIERP
jgi:membrane fusion protein (multidrug efflux system)